MEHNICRENLSAYLDGELPEGGRAELEAHLAVCPACASELAELKRNSDIFKRHAMEPVPPALKEAVFSAKEPARSFRWFPAAALTAAAAAAVVVFVLPKARKSAEGVYSPAVFNAAQESGFGSAAADAAPPETAPESAPGAPAENRLQAQAAGAAGSSLDLGAAQKSERAAADSSYAAPARPAAGAFAQAKFAAKSVSGNMMTAGGAGAKLSMARSAGAVRGAAAKRAAPAAVPDITAGGVRYSAAHWRDSGANGGSVRAYGTDGRLLWEARVFSVPEEPGLEADVQQVHIAAMSLDGPRLILVDERGRRWQLDTASRKAAPLP